MTTCKRTLFGVIGAILPIIGLGSVAGAATITNDGATFIPGLNDASNLPGGSDGSVGTNYTFNGGTGGYGTYVDPYEPTATFSQQFTTGANASGYSLTAVTTKINHAYQANNGYKYSVTIFSGATDVGGGDLPAAATAPNSDGSIDGDFLTYAFTTPITLAANTVYTMTFSKDAVTSGGGAMNFVATSDNYYSTQTGGDHASTTDGSEGTNGKTQIAFDASLAPAAIPEPASLGLLSVAGVGLLARRRRQA